MRNPTYPHSKWTDSPHKERKVIKMNGLTCDLDGFDEKTAKVCGQSGINNSSFPISLDEKKLLPSLSMVSPLESVSLYHILLIPRRKVYLFIPLATDSMQFWVR